MKSEVSDKPEKPGKLAKKKRRFRWGRASLGVLVLGLIVWLVVYLNSDSFRESVRRRVVAELEQITGGKVEMQSLTWKLSRLQFEVKGLTIHGLEAREQAPYIHADRVFARAYIISLFSQKIGLRSLTVDHPAIHLIVYPDGSTNQPVPKVKEQYRSAVDELFDLAVGRLDVANGELLVNEQKVPFAISGERLAATMNYSQAGKSYSGKASLFVDSARFRDFQPLRGDVDVQYVLRRSQVEVTSLKFATEHSTVQGSGTLTDFRHPDVQAKYNASVDAAELSRTARIPQLKGGRLDINGVAAYANQKYSAQGNVAGHSVSWQDASAKVAGVDFSSPFSLTPEKISLPHLSMRALGGGAQGEVQITNWGVLIGSKKLPPQRGTANLKVSGLQASQLASAMATSRLPVSRLNLAGSISGNVNTSWTGSLRNVVTELKLESAAPANPTPQQVPLTAQLQATYHGNTETLDVAGLSAATRDVRLNATGTLGLEDTALKVAFNANNLRELQPMLGAFSPGTRIPVEVNGRASFNGVIFGKLSAPSARGHLDIDNFDTVLASETNAGSKSKVPARMHWDSFTGDITYTPSNLNAQNGILKRGAAQVAFSGNATLNKGSFNPDTSVITATLRVQNANISDVQSAMGLGYPVTGTLSADLRTTGTLQNLRGSGSLQANKLTLYGEPFRTFRADIHFAGNETQFSNILLSHNGAQITGSAAYKYLDKLVRFDLTGKNIELADFRRFQPQRLTMAGKADFHVSGSGTVEAPVVDAQVNFHNLVLNGEQAGDLSVVAETHGADMLLRAQSNFENAMLTINGSMHLRDNFPAQLTIKFQHLDFDPLLRAYLKGKITGHSSMEGYIDIHGPMKSPLDLTILGNIDQLSADIENVKVQNDGPIRFSMGNQAIHVEQLRLVGNQTDLSAHGDVQVIAPHTLDVRAEGHLNLKLLQTFYPNLLSSGDSNFAMHLAGTMNQPQMRGHMDISNGAISVVDLPNGLSKINGRLVLAQDRLQIENLTAHTGGGALALGGFITYRNGVYFDVTATGTDVRLRYPPGVSASANANLRYTGSAQSSLLSGDVTIIRFAMDPRFDFAQYLARAKAPSTPTQNPFLDNLRLDVHITSTPELRVETSLAKLSGDADLRIRGTVANPALLGRVNIAEGNISFSGTKYRLERGDVTFTNPQMIQPVINVEMSARVRGYDITIGFHGPVDKLGITYRSDPPLPSGDIIALLAFGRTREQDLYAQSTPTLATSDVVLSQALNSASTSRVQKLFGVGSVKIDPQYIGGAENNIGPRVTIEQQIKNNITLTYITNLAQSQSEQVIQLEYNVTRSVSIVAVRDQNGILGVDVRIRKRKR
jgi:translocation and assembly module TamB